MVRNTKIHNRLVLKEFFIDNKYLLEYNKDLALVEMLKSISLENQSKVYPYLLKQHDY